MPRSIDFTSIPRKSVEELDKLYSVKTLYVIEDIMDDGNTFHALFQDLIDIMKYGFEHENIRRRPTQFKFKKEDTKVISMPLANFISNLVFWQALIDVERVDVLDESWIFDFRNFNTNTLMEYVNDKLLPVYNIDFASQNAMVDEIYHNIVSISHAFCLLMGMSISIYDLHQLELRNPEVAQIMRGDIDHNLPPNEIEDRLKADNKRLIQLMVEDSEMNDYKPFFASKSCLKENQFKEFAVRIGFKADINGNTVPIFIDNNFLMQGLERPSYVYLNAISGRKAMILSKISMAKPGAFSKKLVYQSVTSTLREDHEMCDSAAFVIYHIKTAEHLKYLHGRYYYDDKGDMQLLDYKRDTHLIDKMVRFRSPATCNSPNGVCKYCYGHLFETNQPLASAGALAALKITGPIGQMVLSAKHDQTTQSGDMNFSDGYYEVFDLANSAVVLREDSDLDAELFIKLTNVKVEEMDDSEFYYVESFDVVDGSNNIIHHIKEESGAHFYLNDVLVAMYKAKSRTKAGDNGLYALEDIDEDESLFTIEVKNKELTEPLKVFTSILNHDAHMGANTISEICQVFADKLLFMGIKYEFVHPEMLIRSLIRKKSDILDFPDFSIGGNPNDYQILKLNDGQLYNPSALISLPYGYLKRQLIGTELYEKHSTGPLDALYVNNLSKHMD